MEILKYGKRFHATVSFDTDTGLKQALATVSDYNPLMKDFPINDLLSATELDRIRFVDNCFTLTWHFYIIYMISYTILSYFLVNCIIYFYYWLRKYFVSITISKYLTINDSVLQL